MSSAPTLPEVGDVVADRYELLEKIGKGGFGVIFRARQDRKPPQVALKVMDYHGLGVPPEEAKKRFRREAIMASNLVHPHAVRQLDFGETPEMFYISMELVEGTTLAERLARQGPLPTELVVQLATAVLDVLRFAHEKDIVHRDLKPDNIMLCRVEGESDVPKVLDFGAAKTLHGEHDLTTAGKAVGSPAYMAPELLAGSDPTPSSDIYSLGITLGEAIVGSKIVAGDNRIERARNQMSPEPLDLPESLLEHRLYPWLEGSIKKRDSERYASADEMLEALKNTDVPGVDGVSRGLSVSTVDDFSEEQTEIVSRHEVASSGPDPDDEFDAGPTQVVSDDSPEQQDSPPEDPAGSLPPRPDDPTEPFEAPDTMPVDAGHNEESETEPLEAVDDDPETAPLGKVDGESFDAPNTEPLTGGEPQQPPRAVAPDGAFEAEDTEPIDKPVHSDHNAPSSPSSRGGAAAGKRADSHPETAEKAPPPGTESMEPKLGQSSTQSRPDSLDIKTQETDDRGISSLIDDFDVDFDDDEFVVAIAFGVAIVVVALLALLYVLLSG